MVSAPEPAGHASTAVSVFAAWMASRKEQLPLTSRSSASVVGLMVAAWAALETNSVAASAVSGRGKVGTAPGSVCRH